MFICLPDTKNETKSGEKLPAYTRTTTSKVYFYVLWTAAPDTLLQRVTRSINGDRTIWCGSWAGICVFIYIYLGLGLGWVELVCRVGGSRGVAQYFYCYIM